MTCIVGLVENGKVYMGGDSAGVAGLSLDIRADAKVFKKGSFVFGFTSSFRMGQLLRYSLTIPDRHPGKDAMGFMVTDFVNAIRGCLKDGGFATKDQEAESGGAFLVGHAGRLFRIEGDYQVGASRADFDACGCGEDIARGALFATKPGDPESRVRLALEAAQRYSAGVRAPFEVVSI